MKQLTFAVITPSFNQGRFIEETINSVLSQEIVELDYIIMDGGSNDETITILEKYNNKLRYVSEKDKGQTDAVNKGIRNTHSDIIGWLNSDDIYVENALNTVLDFFSKHPDIDVVYGMADHIDVDGDFLEKYPTQEFDAVALLSTCYISQPAVFFRRRVIEECGLLDETLMYCMDYEYWIRLSQNKNIKFAHLPILLAATRLHVDTKTLGSTIKVHKEINNMLKKRIGYVPDRWLCNYAHVVLEKSVDRKKHPVRFVVGVSFSSIFASLRWNYKVSNAVVKMTLNWIYDAMKRKWKVRV